MKRRMAQPLFVLSVAVTLVLTLSVVVLSAQFQPIVPDIGFEIEGNTALDQGGVFDWENAEFPPAERIPDPNSKIETDKDVFKPNSKFDDPAGWLIEAGRVGPGQSELINFLHWDIQPGTLDGGRPNDHWLVLGMERIKTPGFFELDFEYNQVAWDGSSGGLTRTPGDVLVGFELRGKPTSKRAEYKVLLLQYWPGAQPSLCSTTLGPGGEPELVEVGTDPCPLYSDSGWYYRLLADDALSAESGPVQATMNKEPFSPSWPAIDGNGQPCDAIGPYQFAEAAINLTALGIEPSCGSVHAKTRSAPHVHSDLKDLVGPVPMECAARLDGHKFLDAAGDPGDPNGIWDPWEPPLEGWEIRLSDGSVTHTDAEGYYAFEDLDYGTYTVSEVCPQQPDGCWRQTAPELLGDCTCGDAVFTVELTSDNPEVNDLDFGNHWTSPPLILVTKDAQISFTRTYTWILDKSVDNPGPILLYPGDYAEVNYEVEATSQYDDSDWAVEGTITIRNLGADPVRLASLTDVITPGDIEVPFDCGGVEIEDVILEALGILTCSYGPIPLPDGSERTNTATVTVQDYAGEWSGTADVVFDQPTTEIDEMARVTDTNWEDEQWEGPEGFDVGAGPTAWVKPYPWKIRAPGDVCGLSDHPNTATLVTNDTHTTLTADEGVQTLGLCPTLAYEDLPLTDEWCNDYDYNDLVVEVPISLEVSDAGDLLSASFEINQTMRSTAFVHEFNLQPYSTIIPCTGWWYTTTFRQDGFEITDDGKYDPSDNNFLLIPDTDDPPNLVELRIDFDVPEPGGCPRDFGDLDPASWYHGEWLFFDPWLTVKPPLVYNIAPYPIRVILPPPEGGSYEPEPRILTVPVAWTPPPEAVSIWCVYSGVTKGEDGQPVFTDYWWDTPPPENCDYLEQHRCPPPEYCDYQRRPVCP